MPCTEIPATRRRRRRSPSRSQVAREPARSWRTRSASSSEEKRGRVVPLVPSPTTSSTRDATPAALTGGRLLARNAAWNLITQCAPLAVAFVTIPVLIAGIGTDRFGVLTLAWITLGYFSLFDLGLGRALTKLVADALGRGE